MIGAWAGMRPGTVCEPRGAVDHDDEDEDGELLEPLFSCSFGWTREKILISE